jgi:hypothetical protein
MSVEDLYIKALEQILVEGQIWLHPYAFKPGGTDEWDRPKKITTDKWWLATARINNRRKEGQGETPREAIIDLYKEL